ncbi:hypothetical protein [Nocardia xishanensis]|uniref:hypothetical protein n=1 Tax=Nocardia xishanensis TaxID=238964 RepID=UPI000ABFE8F5|nr:hypothetical protein [Nocardia xishanensis]
MADNQPIDPREPKGVLRGLQHKPMYEGTVSHSEVAKRRTKNKAARKARKQQRRG